MDWYVVIKTINGHRYYYRQKTWREGKHVRTLSQYIGPAGPEDVVPTGAKKRPTTISKILRDSIKALMDRTQRLDEWTSGWSARRTGPTLVKRQGELDEVVRRLGVTFTANSRGAYYNPKHDVVNIPPRIKFSGIQTEDATGVYYSTVMHELVHWTGHQTRLNRHGDALRTHRGYALEELVAELGAVILLESLGMKLPNLSIHATYFQDWLVSAGDKKDALAYAKTEAERAVQFILENGRIDQ